MVHIYVINVICAAPAECLISKYNLHLLRLQKMFDT